MTNQDTEDEQITPAAPQLAGGGKGPIDYIRKLIVTTTLGALAAVQLLTNPGEVYNEESADIPGVGRVPISKFDAWTASYDRELAENLNSLYHLTRHCQQGAQCTRSDVPFSIRAAIAWNNPSPIIVDHDGTMTRYDETTVLHDVRESRKIFAESMGRVLEGITADQYAGLRPELQGLVDGARALVEENTLEQRTDV